MAAVEPRTRDPNAVRKVVLDAAMKLFADHGFAETSVRDISQASGVSHPLILHHFGSKEDLYKEVKRRVVEGYAQRFPAAARAVNQPLNVRTELKRLMTYLEENEMALRLCARTRLDGDNQVWPGEPDLLDLIRRRIEVAQKKGVFRDDLHPTLTSIMLVGLVFFWLDNRKHFAERFKNLPGNQEFLRIAIALIERGVLPTMQPKKKRAVKS
jgi:TetR/AcrR family transcriptional regulator